MLLALLLALPDALLQRPYSAPAPWHRVSNRCPMPVAAMRVVGGALPPGLRLSARGAVEGVPVTPGDYVFTVEISDGCAQYQEERRIRVTPAPILLAETETLAYRSIQGAPPFTAQIVRVSGSTPGLPYSIDIQYPDSGAGSPWLYPTMRDGALPSAGTALEADVVSLVIDPGKLPAGDYQAKMRISAWQSANAPELLFRLHIDSPLTVLQPLTSPPGPLEPAVILTAPPNLSDVVPPPVRRPAANSLQKRRTSPGIAAQPHSAPSPIAPARSRVLPYPKITLPKRTAKPPHPAPETALPPKPHANASAQAPGRGARGDTSAHQPTPTPLNTHGKKPSAMSPRDSSAARHD